MTEDVRGLQATLLYHGAVLVAVPVDARAECAFTPAGTSRVSDRAGECCRSCAARELTRLYIGFPMRQVRSLGPDWPCKFRHHERPFRRTNEVA